MVVWWRIDAREKGEGVGREEKGMKIILFYFFIIIPIWFNSATNLLATTTILPFKPNTMRIMMPKPKNPKHVCLCREMGSQELCPSCREGQCPLCAVKVLVCGKCNVGK